MSISGQTNIAAMALAGFRAQHFLGYAVRTRDGWVCVAAVGMTWSKLACRTAEDARTTLRTASHANRFEHYKELGELMQVIDRLPPFAQPGQQFDINVSSMANAKSLKGGMLLMTPLKGADGKVYAVAQGSVIVGGAGGSAGGTSVTINHLSAGRVPAGATVERAVPMQVGQGDYIVYELSAADFGTAMRVANAINQAMPGAAMPLDARRIQVRAPESAPGRLGQ